VNGDQDGGRATPTAVSSADRKDLPVRATRSAAALLSAACVLAMTAACGGSDDPPASSAPSAPSSPKAKRPNGVEKLPADEILKQTREVALKAGSAHVVARFVTGKDIVDVDTLVRGTTGSGSISVNGLGAEVRRVEDTVYLKGNDAFNVASAGKEGAKLLAGKWLFGPADNPALADAAGSLDYRTVVTDALQLDGKLRKDKVMTFAGYRAIRLRDDDSYIYVALDGKPYPMAVRARSGSGDRIRLSQWGKEVLVDRPAEADVIDVTQLSDAPAETPAATPPAP
jgi:hypothetical protein